MRAFLFLSSLSVLSGCISLELGEKNFINPARVNAAPPAHRIDAAALHALLPAATLQEEGLATGDGATLHGITVRQPSAVATVLYFGGNAFRLDDAGESVLTALTACHVNVTIFDYRGYGRSDGTPTIAAMKSDALRVFDLANAQDPGRIVVHGQSMGSFIAGHVAQQRPARGLVLESTATNVTDWANASMPWYLSLFASVELSDSLKGVDNVAAVSKFGGASLVLTGADDEVTAPRLARQVYDAIPGKSKQILVIAGAGHNDVLENAATMPAYCAFVNKLAIAP
jgi:hypothetical protein